MIIVTGGAGFIGSNLVKELNKQGKDNIVIVDDLKDHNKMKNLIDLRFSDYIHFEDFFPKFAHSIDTVETIFHQGACSDTTVDDLRYVMKVNFEYSKDLLKLAEKKNSSFIYASSASVYGNAINGFEEIRENEKPLNYYAFSKFAFDQYVRSNIEKIKSQVVGLRYFNVYGPREQHKGNMSSTAYQFFKQIKQTEVVKLFEGNDGYANGEQMRDFIYVKDIVSVNLWFNEYKSKSGIFNVGTGKERSFNSLANAVINFYKKGEIKYIPFPVNLLGHYQNFTKSENGKLYEVGYDLPFHSLEDGIKDYMSILNMNSND
jgi:ADP-L-glycero-D-manno-heptose 6-epimerase